MRNRLIALALLAASAVPLVSGQAAADSPDAALDTALADPARNPANRARDVYRHPRETLGFFGIKPDATVVEIWPGGGWYTEILAPYLAANGQLTVAGPWPDGVGRIRKLQAEHSDRFGKVGFAAFPARDGEPRVADGSADLVVTFRNIHNWRMGYQREGQDYSAEAMRQIHAMLKPGGVLGIVDHRLPESADSARETSSGYIKVSTVRKLAEDAGFTFAGASEINANPKDTADWPDGVWTLPPALALKDKDRDRYVAIGESDRMTLKFVKPAKK